MNEDHLTFAVKHCTAASVILGEHTDVAILEFQDKLFVTITQYEKIGAMVHVTQSISPDKTVKTVYDTKIVLGEDKIELHALARHLAELLRTDKAFLFGIALKNFDQPAVKLITQFVVETYQNMNK